MATTPKTAGPKPKAVGQDDPYREYYFVQGIVSGYNQDCLEIKKWSVTAASIVAVVGQVGLSGLAPVLILIIMLALAFWFTEWVWRVNQRAFIRRLRELEAADAAGPQISAKWERFYRGKPIPTASWNSSAGEIGPSRAWKTFFSRETAMPHLIIVLLALLSLLAVEIAGAGTEPPKPTAIEGKLDVRLRDAASPARLGAPRP